jgi:hypothetical protein
LGVDSSGAARFGGSVKNGLQPGREGGDRSYPSAREAALF